MAGAAFRRKSWDWDHTMYLSQYLGTWYIHIYIEYKSKAPDGAEIHRL